MRPATAEPTVVLDSSAAIRSLAPADHSDVGGGHQDDAANAYRQAPVGSPPSAAALERSPEGGRSGAPAVATAESVVRQIAPRIAALPRTGRHEIVLRLEPPSLGAVRIEAALDGRELTLRIHAGDAGTRELLEQGLPRLRHALEQEGLGSGHVSVQLGLEAGTRQPASGAPFSRPAPAEPAEVPRSAAPPRGALAAVGGSTAIDLWV
jgi:flagellar hook-length control protein FliK